MDPKKPSVYGQTDLTYNDYLKVPELLSLQIPQSEPAHHDEMLFIIIHQAYELWFKLILHELENSINYMENGQPLRARHFVHRVVEIMRVLVQQIHILETMTPAEFLKFRDRLNPASGFQSIQFREVEYIVGLKEPAYLKHFSNRPDLTAKLQARLDQKDLRQAYYSMLRGLGYKLPATIVESVVTPDEAEKLAVFAAIKPIYQNPDDNLPLYLLSEALVELDEFLSLWREHHVRVVERVIGMRQGTGGSSGAAYLRSTTSKKAFPYLWEVRTVLENRP